MQDTDHNCMYTVNSKYISGLVVSESVIFVTPNLHGLVLVPPRLRTNALMELHRQNAHTAQSRFFLNLTPQK